VSERKGSCAVIARRLAQLGLASAAVMQGFTSAAHAGSPLASFVWFPPAPISGESVSLASTATDASSAITGYAWELQGSGPFAEGGPVTTTTFSMPGSHVVRLRVSAADGSFSEAVETIVVSPPPLIEMLPSPIVRIVSSDLHAGIRLRLLSVEAPPGAQIAITCQGRGCPLRYVTKTASSSHVESVAVRFPRFERFLPAGVTIAIRVSKPGEIGKYTRLTVRRARPPARSDACLQSTALQPVACPVVAAAPA
jgi:hypothetical protein